ncbi:MAG: hypothetical protein QM736_02905 [Vicinamibacterales bacterium]
MNNRVDITRTGIDTATVLRLYGGELAQQRKQYRALVTTREQQLAAAKDSAAVAQATAALKSARSSLQGTLTLIDALPRMDLRSVSIGEGLTLIGMLVRERVLRRSQLLAGGPCLFRRV